MASHSYTKLRSGEWGLRIQGEAKTGDTVIVVTKAGESKIETVGRVLWTGNGVTLATKGGPVRSSTRYRSSTRSRNECGSPHRGPCCVQGGANLNCRCGAECCGEND